MTPRDIVKAVCAVEAAVGDLALKISAGSSCATPTFVDACTGSLIEQRLTEIRDLLQVTEFDYEFVCTDEGVKIVQLDTKTGAKTVLNIDGTVNTSAIIEPCSSSVESDAAKICIGGVPALMWVVKENGVPNGAVYYTDKEGQLISAPSPSSYTLGECVGECQPQIWTGDGTQIGSSIPFHSAVITKPECCIVDIVTSAGTIRMGRGEISYSTILFTCPITITAVNVITPNCSASSVLIKLNRN